MQWNVLLLLWEYCCCTNLVFFHVYLATTCTVNWLADWLTWMVTLLYVPWQQSDPASECVHIHPYMLENQKRNQILKKTPDSEHWHFTRNLPNRCLAVVCPHIFVYLHGGSYIQTVLEMAGGVMVCVTLVTVQIGNVYTNEDVSLFLVLLYVFSWE